MKVKTINIKHSTNNTNSKQSLQKGRAGNTGLFFMGSAIGLLVFLAVFGFSSLNPTNDFFCSVGFIENDIAQHYAGWMLYRQSPWAFPLGVGANMAFPYASSVSYTDSIPLFAVFFKVLSPLLPQTFQYFGLFVAASYALMGGFASLLLALFTKSKVLIALSAAVFAFSPILMERAFRHVALSAQFLIVAAIYYFFKNKGTYSVKKAVPFFVINALAITIHPYFLPFTFAILFAYCLHWAVGAKKIVKPLGALLGCILATLLVGVVFGAFHSIDSSSDSGYGQFSFNLNAFFNPISEGIADWSLFMDGRPNIFYQTEGFNYLGFGILLALVPCVLFALLNKNARTEGFQVLKGSLGLVLVAAVLLVFAAGNMVAYGGLVLFEYTVPSFLTSITSTFRASGRFAWLAFYLIYFFVLFVITRIRHKMIPALLLSALLVVQIVDLSPTIATKHNYFAGKGFLGDGHTVQALATDPFWDEAFEQFDSVVLLSGTINNGSIEFAVRAGKQNKGMTVNVAFEARAENENRGVFLAEQNQLLIDGQANADTMYLISDPAPYQQHIDSGLYAYQVVDGQGVLYVA